MPLNREEEGLVAAAAGVVGIALLVYALTRRPPAPLDEEQLEVTSRYGERRPSGLHGGVDIRAPIGTPVLAPFDGVWGTWQSDRGGLGGSITDDAGTSVRFAHLSAYRAADGAHVSKGDELALTGNSGYTTGPHLHVEVYKHGKRVDPMKAFPEWPWAGRV